MQLIEVNNKALEKVFIQFPIELYKNEKNYIRPLDKDIKAAFDPSKNKNFRNGEAIRWVLKNDQDKYIGRIAAFYDKKTSQKNDQPTGGLGFPSVLTTSMLPIFFLIRVKKSGLSLKVWKPWTDQLILAIEIVGGVCW